MLGAFGGAATLDAAKRPSEAVHLFIRGPWGDGACVKNRRARIDTGGGQGLVTLLGGEPVVDRSRGVRFPYEAFVHEAIRWISWWP
jgi:hypothetical protein